MPRRTSRDDPEQLKMFMTPREIVSKYQVLDADRHEIYDERGGEGTNRPETTAGNANFVMNTARREHWAARPGAEAHKYARFDESRAESDEEVLSRKAEEASYDPEYYGGMRGHALTGQAQSFNENEALNRASAPARRNIPSLMRMPDSEWDAHQMEVNSYIDRKRDQHYQAQAEIEPESLYESIQRGGVEQPVHLGTQFGSQGKPMIVGGHHRIAAALETRPDDYIPVVHHEDIWEAKQGKGYKYR